MKFKRFFKRSKAIPNYNVSVKLSDITKKKKLAKIDARINSKSTLSKMYKKLVNKKTFLAVSGVTIIGFSVSHILNYIEANSGCFKKQLDGTICKIKQLSCCQPNEVKHILTCSDLVIVSNPCGNYKENDDNCCEHCKCGDGIKCKIGETVHCQRPTVDEALSYFSKELGSGLWSSIKTIFPWVEYVLYVVAIIITVWLVSFILPIFYRIFPRKRNQDV